MVDQHLPSHGATSRNKKEIILGHDTVSQSKISFKRNNLIFTASSLQAAVSNERLLKHMLKVFTGPFDDYGGADMIFHHQFESPKLSYNLGGVQPDPNGLLTPAFFSLLRVVSRFFSWVRRPTEVIRRTLH